MTRTVVLFPGQGGYAPGIFAYLHREHPSIAATLGRVEQVAEVPSQRVIRITDLLLDPDAPGPRELATTDPGRLHLAIFGTEIVIFQLLTQEYGIQPDLVMGHSFGEIAALTAAGAYPLDDGIRMVCLRDRALQEAPPPPGGMLAVSAGSRRADALIAAVDDWNTVIATYNSPEQVVVSGSTRGLEAVATVAAALGLRATRLDVSYPFHNRLLAQAAHIFRRGIGDIRPQPLRHRLYSPLLGKYADDLGRPSADATRLLSCHLTSPVRFADAVRAVHADGCRIFIECGPGAVLTGLAAATVPGITALAPLRERADAEGFAASLTAREPVPTATVAAGEAAATTTEAVTTPPGPGTDPVLAADLRATGLFDRLRRLYAETVGYPANVFEPSLDLEADLGIDSLTQTALLSKAIESEGLPEPPTGVRIADHPTLESVAELIGGLATESGRAHQERL